MKDTLDELIAGRIPYIIVGSDVLPADAILLPGSFNPLHRGHEGLLLAAEKVSGREGLLELSITNVDKPPLDIVEVERRLLQLKGRYCAVVTCASTFVEKAELFPGAWFALGYDTVVRLLSPDYHADVPGMLERFRELGTRFVVAGRLYNGSFQGLGYMGVPAGFEDLFIPIPEAVFREDVSSTELRKRLGS
ncbi:MAG: hypothetical protein HKP10_07490 [Kiritimatiellales bacterium]|nr:hypothetical protein [Kiritimatiellales bacterium]